MLDNEKIFWLRLLLPSATAIGLVLAFFVWQLGTCDPRVFWGTCALAVISAVGAIIAWWPGPRGGI